MRTTLISSFFCLLLTLPLCGDAQQLADYSFGRYGTRSFEYLSFSDRGEITYSTVNEEKNIKLVHAGLASFKSHRGFKVRFPDGKIKIVIPSGLTLRVKERGKAEKIFRWRYEGPVGGKGQECMECVNNEIEAMAIVRTHFMKKR